MTQATVEPPACIGLNQRRTDISQNDHAQAQDGNAEKKVLACSEERLRSGTRTHASVQGSATFARAGPQLYQEIPHSDALVGGGDDDCISGGDMYPERVETR